MVKAKNYAALKIKWNHAPPVMEQERDDCAEAGGRLPERSQ